MVSISKNRLLRRSLLVLIILSLTFLCVLHTESETIPDSNPIVIESEKTVDELILEIAPKFNQDPQLIKKIIYCESGGKVKSHDNGRGTNITGIHNTTFDYWLKKYKETYYNEELNKNSTYDQIKMMSWAFSQGEEYRRAWTTYVAYKNGGTYTFYSKLLEGTYTARCK